MTGMHALWLPIVLSAAAVFVVSSLVHMLLDMVVGWHKHDFRPLPNQDAVMAALRPFAIAPGDYTLPRPDNMQQMRSPEFKEMINKGPKVVDGLCCLPACMPWEKLSGSGSCTSSS